jgi:hypothetical protein
MGTPFPHERYVEELSALRDELKLALSVQPGDGSQPKTRPATELAQLITDIKGAHTVEAVPVKRPQRPARLERPVTGRIRDEVTVQAAPEIVAEEIGGKGGEVELVRASESPAEKAVVPKTGFSVPPEGRRRRYQKWLF